jgi:uncharacterized OB-fold protein
MLEAIRCSNGHVHHPPHPRCPDCGESPTDRIDLAEEVGTIVTWTSTTATPPGVRELNHLAIVEFDLGTPEAVTGGSDNGKREGYDDEGGRRRDGTVRAIGGLTSGGVAIGDRVRPVYVEELRNPEAGIREPASQEWGGYRFEPI